MKKIIIGIISILLLISGIIGINTVNAKETTYTLRFKADDITEDFDLYLLLPKEYIIFAIKEAGLDIEYNGAETLKENDIPNIEVNKNNIMDEVYQEDGREYVQILFDKNEDNIYEFEVLTSYVDMDIKFRIKNINKDYIAHIDNFKIENGVCEVDYNYRTDEVKQLNQTFIPFLTKLLVIILIIIIVVAIISYIKHKN